MIQPIEVSLIISFIILAGHSFTWDGQIFAGLKKLISPSKKISKPLYGCPICMTPWWGTLFYIICFSGLDQDLIEWFVVIATATGFSVIWVMLIYIKDYCKHRTPEEDQCCSDHIQKQIKKYDN